jgi:hypothetical protein
MKKWNVLNIVFLVVCSNSLMGMQTSESEVLKKKQEDEAYSKCMSTLSNLPTQLVPQKIVKDASFDPSNTFQRGELVITPNIAGTFYMYSCVEDLYVSQNRKMVGIRRNYPSPNFPVGFEPGSVGKLKIHQVVPLVEQNAKKIADLIKTGKLKQEDIRPPILPEELYEKVKEYLKK